MADDERRNRIKFLVEELLCSFQGHKSTARISIWHQRLMETSFTANEVKNAGDYCINNFEKCPSYAEFKNVILKVNEKPDEAEVEEALHQKVYEKEMAQFRKEKVEVVNAIGQVKLDEFTKEYINQVWPELNISILKDFNLGVGLLQRCAVRDLYKCKYEPEKTISLAIQKNKSIQNYKTAFDKLPQII